MKVYLPEVEFGRYEPKEDGPERYHFQPLIEVDDETVARWRQAIEQYYRAQAEMEQVIEEAHTGGHTTTEG
jgi:hypothetical protein